MAFDKDVTMNSTCLPLDLRTHRPQGVWFQERRGALQRSAWDGKRDEITEQDEIGRDVERLSSPDWEQNGRG